MTRLPLMRLGGANGYPRVGVSGHGMAVLRLRMDFSPEAPAESHQPGPAKKAVTLDRGRGDQLYLARLQVAILSLSGKVGAVCRRRARFANSRSPASPASLVSRPRRRSASCVIDLTELVPILRSDEGGGANKAGGCRYDTLPEIRGCSR